MRHVAFKELFLISFLRNLFQHRTLPSAARCVDKASALFKAFKRIVGASISFFQKSEDTYMTLRAVPVTDAFGQCRDFSSICVGVANIRMVATLFCRSTSSPLMHRSNALFLILHVVFLACLPVRLRVPCQMSCRQHGPPNNKRVETT